jgi:hypothetical protein
MQNPSPTTDSYIKLMASVIGLIAAVIALIAAIINKNQEERKALARLLVYSDVVLLVVGCAVVLIFGSVRISTLFFMSATIIYSLKYVRQTFPAQRMETFLLVIHWSATLFMLVMLQLLQVTDQIGHVVGILDKMVH